jgi:hypothetical protein
VGTTGPANEAPPPEDVLATTSLRSDPEPSPRAASTIGVAFRGTLDGATAAPAFGPSASFTLGLGERFVAGIDVAYFRVALADSTQATVQHAPGTAWFALSFGRSVAFSVGTYATADLKLASTDALTKTALGVEVGPMLRLRIPLAGDFGFVVRANGGYRVRRQQFVFDRTTVDDGSFAASAETGVDFRWR